MADVKKKSSPLFTHWARPRVRTYEYNFEYGESYYRPMVRYISTSKVMSSSSSSSSFNYETKRAQYERRRRAGSPPGALSFIERWSYEPFYGYGVGFRSRQSVERSLSSSIAASSSYESSASRRIASDFYNSFGRSARAQSVAAMERSSSCNRSARAQSIAAMEQSSSINRSSRAQSVAAMESSLQSSTDINLRSRMSRARSVEAAAASSCAAGYASDDCLMRSTALNSSALQKSQDILNTSSLTRKTLMLDGQNVLHGKTLDERYYLDYPKQHLVCPPDCPLHNNPEWRRRFLIGNRFLDAAALGGFDVLYDPSVFTSSRRLLSKLAETSESESDEILIQRESSVESSRRRIRATASMA